MFDPSAQDGATNSRITVSMGLELTEATIGVHWCWIMANVMTGGVYRRNPAFLGIVLCRNTPIRE